MNGVGFLSKYEAGTLRLTDVNMTVSEDGPVGSISVGVTISPGKMFHDWTENQNTLVVGCHPRLTVTVTDNANNAGLASFDIEMSASYRYPQMDNSEIAVDVLEDVFLECLTSAYSFARNKVHELASISPMNGLLLPNADVNGLRRMIRRDIVNIGPAGD